MKKYYVILVLSILFISPSFVSANTANISSPQKADRYYLGDEIEIKWRPSDADTYKAAGVKSAEIQSTGSNTYGSYIYGPKVYGDPINYSGLIEYELPSFVGTYNTGNYRVKLTFENGDVEYSDEFGIINPANENIVELQDTEYRITDIETEDPYYTGEKIELSLKAWEKSGVILDRNKGFNVQARIYKSNSSQAFDSINGYFNGNEWFLTFDPVSRDGRYKIEITAYCSDHNTTSYCANKYKDDYDSQLTKIVTIEVEESNEESFDEMFKKWGDLRFINPKEGQKNPEEIVAGQQYTLKWENIVKAEWTDVHLYKYDRKPSNDYLRNGPTNVSTGTKVLDLGTAYLGQEDLKNNLPSNLEPGYYYFRFGGKAAGDSSPAIEIVSDNSKNHKNISIKTPDGSVLYKGESNLISWGGGEDIVKIGIKAENGNLGWIETDGDEDGSLRWNAEKVCDLAMTVCWNLEQIVGQYGKFRIIAVSEDDNGNIIASRDGNYDESGYYRISTEDNKPITDKNSEKEGDLSKVEVLNLIESLFGKNSDAYKIISLLINLGIIK